LSQASLNNRTLTNTFAAERIGYMGSGTFDCQVIIATCWRYSLLAMQVIQIG